MCLPLHGVPAAPRKESAAACSACMKFSRVPGLRNRIDNTPHQSGHCTHPYTKENASVLPTRVVVLQATQRTEKLPLCVTSRRSMRISDCCRQGQPQCQFRDALYTPFATSVKTFTIRPTA